MKYRSPAKSPWLVFLLLVAIQGSALAADPADPWEGFNRRVFVFNEYMDRHLLKPLAKGYQKLAPDFVETGVGNFFGNLGEVPNFFNHLLQGRAGEAGHNGGRFFVNSTLGLLGLFDVASKLGIQNEQTDLGVTLGRWGFDPGPFLMLPFVGPSSVRDGVGYGGDLLLTPLFYVDDPTLRWSLRGLEVVDTRAGLLAVEDLITGDRYIFLRQLYLQRREFLVTGELPEDDFGEDDF